MKKLLTFFTAFLLFGSMMTVQADITIKGKVPAEWTNDIYVFLYSTDADGFHAATHDGDWWSYTYAGSSSSINAIFVNGNDWGGNANQTVDITDVTSDACYQISTNGSNKCSAVSIDCSGAPVEPTTIIIKGKVPAEWTNDIYVFLYSTDADGFHAATHDGDWWSYTYAGSSSSINAIFVNGNDWGGNANQTVDITDVTSDACYQISTNGSNKCSAVSIDCSGAPVEPTTIIIKGKVPAEWTNDIYVYMYDTDADGFHAATHDGDWWSYTYTGLSSSINAIFINGNDWSGGDVNQTVDITDISSDVCYQISTNGSNKCSAVSIDCSGAPVEPTTPVSVATKGGWDDWADALNFTSSDGLTATATLSDLPAGNYEFKIIVGETTGDAATWDWRSNANAYHRFWTSASGITENLDNMELQADADGDYILTWTFATNALSITFPETPKTGTNEVKFFPPRTEEHPWSSVYVYAWRRTAGEDVRLTDEWPGDLATKDGEWYKATIAKGACAIFHDNAGMQSFDIMNVQKDVCYISNEIVDGDPIKAKFYENCTVEYYLTGDEGIMGSGNAWKADVADRKLVGNEITRSLSAGIYEFKITNGSWAWSLGGKEHLSSTCSNVAVTSGSGNVKFKIESAKNVRISYDPATQKICLDAETVLPFEDVRTGLTPDNFYTICNSREMKQIRGASLWSFASKDADFAYLVREDAPFAAGKPFIVWAESDKIEAILDGSTEDAGLNGALHGTFSLMEQGALDAAGDNIYLVIENKLRRVDGQAGNRLPAYRAYVDIDEIPNTGAPAGLPKHRVRAMPMQTNVATGIDVLNASEKPVKVMIDGQLFILRGEKLYDATGRLVK